MKNQFTIGLVGVAAVLGGYMVFVEAKKEAPVDTKEVQVWSLTEHDVKDLKTLVFKAEGKTAQYVRDGESWKLSSEPKRALKPGDWDPAYNNLKNLMAVRFVEDGNMGFQKYGLDTPDGTIVWGDEKSPFQLQIGDKNPTGDAYYVHVNRDDKVYLVSSWKVDEWARLAKEPPLEALPTPAPSASAAASPAPAASPAATGGHGDHDGHNH